MAIDERLLTMPGQWAKNAQTVIPTPPLAGTAYRNTALTADDVEAGQAYDKAYDSARYNQMDYLTTGLVQGLEQYGLLPWSGFTNYAQSAFCLGLDGILYQALQPSGPAYGGAQPTSNAAYWLNYAGVLGIRKRITTPLTLYVRSNGNNNNDGLSPETAWADPLEAAYYINNKVDLANTYATIDIGSGTFDWDSAVAIAPICSGEGGNMQAEQTRYAVRIIGAGQDNTILRDGIQVGAVSTYIKGLKAIPGTSRVTCAFEALIGANLTCENVSCELNDTGNNYVRGFGVTQAQLLIVGNTKVSGTRAYSLVHGSYQSTITLAGAFAVTNSAMVVSADVMRSIANSYFLLRATCSGTCVGKKYAISSNSGIDSGGTYNSIPGTLAGTVDATTFGWLK